MSGKAITVGLALSWDGARLPVRLLPSAAQRFLRGKSGRSAAPGGAKLARLLAADSVQELRLCWLPRLKGGSDVLAAPFSTARGLRIPFRAVQSKRFGDVLGVVYRR